MDPQMTRSEAISKIGYWHSYTVQNTCVNDKERAKMDTEYSKVMEALAIAPQDKVERTISEIASGLSGISVARLMESDVDHEFLVYIEHLRSAMKTADAVMEARVRKSDLSSWDQEKVVAAIERLQRQVEGLNMRLNQVSQSRQRITYPPYHRPLGPR